MYLVCRDREDIDQDADDGVRAASVPSAAASAAAEDGPFAAHAAHVADATPGGGGGRRPRRGAGLRAIQTLPAGRAVAPRLRRRLLRRPQLRVGLRQRGAAVVALFPPQGEQSPPTSFKIAGMEYNHNKLKIFSIFILSPLHSSMEDAAVVARRRKNPGHVPKNKGRNNINIVSRYIRYSNIYFRRMYIFPVNLMDVELSGYVLCEKRLDS